MKITTRYQTLCTVGYTGGGNNPSATGGVCHIQVRRAGKKILARKVNTNGRHSEIIGYFEPSAEQMARYESIAKATR